MGRHKASYATPTIRTASLRAPLPTRSANIATHIAATGMWPSCRRACLPRGAFMASSCVCFTSSQTSRRTTTSRPLGTSPSARSSVIDAAFSSSKTGAPSGWHALRLWHYVALPPPRAAMLLPLAARRPSIWPTMIMTGTSATSKASPRPR